MKVLIVKLTSMGDLVQALPAITDACRAVPGIEFDWVVDEAFAEIPRWHPAIRRVIRTAHRRWKEELSSSFKSGELGRFLGELRRERYDLVIDAQSNIKSAVVTALARGVKHGPDKASAREYPAHWAYRHRHFIDPNQLAIERWRQLFASALGYLLPSSAPDFGLADTEWPIIPDLPKGPYLVAVPNASWQNKYWPESHWRQLIATAGEQGYQVLLSWGSQAEYNCSSRIAENLANAVVLPRKTLSEWAVILKASRGAICMDTGLAHVAAALDVPTVTLYGPTDPRLIGATGARAEHITATGFDCIPCYRRQCTVPGYEGDVAQCLVRIAPAQVWQTFSKLIAGT